MDAVSDECVDLFKVMRIGADLLSDGGLVTGYDNPEYDRGIIEMTTEILGLRSDDKVTVERIMRGMKQ